MVRKRGPLKEPGLTKLKRNIPRLSEICDPDILLPRLFARDVIDSTDKEVVKKEENTKNKRAAMEKLLDILLDCGEDSLDITGECFRECGYDEALKILGLPINDVRRKDESRNTSTTNVIPQRQTETPVLSDRLIKGRKLKKRRVGGNVSISWKQGSVFGIGGDRHQSYTIVHYETSTNEMIPVYIQNTRDYKIPETMVIDDKLQYGMNNGVLFLVYHDRNQMPFQHRFIQSETEKMFNMINLGVDLSWAVGKFLHSF